MAERPERYWVLLARDTDQFEEVKGKGRDVCMCTGHIGSDTSNHIIFFLHNLKDSLISKTVIHQPGYLTDMQRLDLLLSIHRLMNTIITKWHTFRHRTSSRIIATRLHMNNISDNPVLLGSPIYLLTC